MILASNKAAQYVRMSTDMQRYSIENQSEAIALYAARRGLTIVQTYEDAGRSGLRIEGRDALQELLRDVCGGSAAFETILVYDVSRWGRFQDADESAYYEFLCKEAGVKVEYCAEVFDNDGSLASTVLKNIKRAMAGEFSRELSAKVFAGQCRVVSKGFFIGSHPGYGLRRCLVDEAGRRGTILSAGQRKRISTERTILVLGPMQEVAVIREVYELFVVNKMTLSEIARHLNQRAIRNSSGAVWNSVAIRQILTNEKYAGSAVYNRTSRKLNTRSKRNLPERWIKTANAFDAVVTQSRFREAQLQLIDNARAYTDNEMLDHLTAIWCSKGRLTAGLLDTSFLSPRVNAYKVHFGSLMKAYEKVGYVGHFAHGRSANFRLFQTNQIKDEMIRRGYTVHVEDGSSYLVVNDELVVAVVSGSTSTSCGKSQWRLPTASERKPDILVVVWLNNERLAVVDYLLIPLLFIPNGSWLSITRRRLLRLCAFRSPTLAPLYNLCERQELADLA